MPEEQPISKSVRLAQTSLLQVYYFSRYFLRHFYQLRGMQTASSLAYTTLLSIVPLVTVMFSLFGEISILRDVSHSIQNFIFSSFVPELGWTVQGYIMEFSDKASHLTISGSIILVVIAIMLMATIDNAFNRIWFVRSKRNPVSRILVYWAILTMGPMLIGVGLASTSYILSLPIVADVDTSFNIKARLIGWLPFLTTTAAFSLLYIVVPNCFVPKRHALIGGLICGVLFELAKYGFGIYVRAMTSYENIYGTISVIPLFLIWIYVSWMIVLFGAHITYCLSSFRYLDELENKSKKGWTMLDVLRVLEYFYDAQKEGRTVSIRELRKSVIYMPHHEIFDLLDQLKLHKWINQNNGEWLLSTDMNERTLLDLYKILNVRLPVSDYEYKHDTVSINLKNRMVDHQQQFNDALQISFSDFFNSDN